MSRQRRRQHRVFDVREIHGDDLIMQIADDNSR
jgi:hypothetical protein